MMVRTTAFSDSGRAKLPGKQKESASEPQPHGGLHLASPLQRSRASGSQWTGPSTGGLAQHSGEGGGCGGGRARSRPNSSEAWRLGPGSPGRWRPLTWRPCVLGRELPFAGEAGLLLKRPVVVNSICFRAEGKAGGHGYRIAHMPHTPRSQRRTRRPLVISTHSRQSHTGKPQEQEDRSLWH